MNQMTKERRAAVVRALVEGNSIRATVRMTGAAKNTVAKLLRDLGEACSVYQDKVLRDLPCQRIQVDEIWSFCYSKQKNVPASKRGQFGYGDVWTWVAVCADTKLIPCWVVGLRDGGSASDFMHDLASRLRGRVQLTSDALKAYRQVVPDAFGDDVDFAQLRKVYGVIRNDNTPERRYSPAVVLGWHAKSRIGNPDPRHISTSYIERQNLTMRMGMRRFTRLTNGFSKKIENHAAAIAVHFMYYNFCRVHMTIKTTPAVAAGVADHVWTVEEMVGLLGKESN